MIQLDAFGMSKDIARLPYGRLAREHFLYNADVRRQWEKSYSTSKILETIGSMCVPAENVPAVRRWLGQLSPEELLLRARFNEVYAHVAKLTTTVPVSFNAEPDFLETLLDARLIDSHISSPRRVLDIGPGAGRHMINLFLRSNGPQNSYVGVEAIGLPYVMQNMVSGILTLQDSKLVFRDQIDYEHGRLHFKVPEDLPGGSIWHLPLWRADVLPEKTFDLILCNYVLDEVAAHDFDRIADILSRCLAPEGLVYCRGSQQRSMLKDVYLFGYGTFHQRDITKELLSRGLKVKTCDLHTATMTRSFVRADSKTHQCSPDGYATIVSDVPLVETIQRDFIRNAVDQARSSKTPVLIWVDHGFDDLCRYMEEYVPDLNLVGITNDHIVHRGEGPLGLTKYPLENVRDLGVKTVFILGMKTRLAVRELREALAPAILESVSQFTYPFAFGNISETA